MGAALKMISFFLQAFSVPSPSPPPKLRRSVHYSSPPPFAVIRLVTEILLASTKLGLLDRLGAVDGSLTLSLSAEAVLIFEHGARVGNRGARAPEVGVEGEDC